MLTFQSIKLFHISVTAIVLLFPGCSKLETARQDHALKSVVREYNNLLIEVNKTRDVRPLKKLADEPVVEKLYWWMAAWEDGNVYLDAELKNIDFDNLKITGENAAVVTSENWSYIYRDLNTQQIAEPRQSISYKIQYNLKKREDRWLIADINILEEK